MNLEFYKNIVAKYPEEFNLFKDKIFPIVMKWEGGGKLHKVANDSGGWTLFGIAFNYWKHLFKDFNDFKDTTLEEASHIAFVKFYLAIRADAMPYETKLYYFDMAYNMGTSTAIKIMQECAGVKADGVIGMITLSMMKNVSESCLKQKRESFYYRLVESKSVLRKFLKGWLNRSKSIYDFKY